VALATCAELPELEPDDRSVLAPLAARGVAAAAAVWDDPTVDWTRFDLVVVRSTWDYIHRRDEFLAWTARVPRLMNPPRVLAWNTDKRYLDDLAAAGAPVVATTWVRPGDAWAAPDSGTWVVKPSVSAGSLDTGRYDLGQPAQRALALAHAERLGAAGRIVMAQPYLASVDQRGETGLVYLGGRYSHAIRKGPMLRGPDAAADGLYVPEEISPRTPTPAERRVAETVLGALAFPEPLLYARVDLIDGPDGAPLLVELELTEPSLFLDTAPGAADRFAVAIANLAAP
jgi:hypothetical protein